MRCSDITGLGSQQAVFAPRGCPRQFIIVTFDGNDSRTNTWTFDHLRCQWAGLPASYYYNQVSDHSLSLSICYLIHNFPQIISYEILYFTLVPPHRHQEMHQTSCSSPQGRYLATLHVSKEVTGTGGTFQCLISITINDNNRLGRRIRQRRVSNVTIIISMKSAASGSPEVHSACSWSPTIYR